MAGTRIFQVQFLFSTRADPVNAVRRNVAEQVIPFRIPYRPLREQAVISKGFQHEIFLNEFMNGGVICGQLVVDGAMIFFGVSRQDAKEDK